MNMCKQDSCIYDDTILYTLCEYIYILYHIYMCTCIYAYVVYSTIQIFVFVFLNVCVCYLVYSARTCWYHMPHVIVYVLYLSCYYIYILYYIVCVSALRPWQLRHMLLLGTSLSDLVVQLGHCLPRGKLSQNLNWNYIDIFFISSLMYNIYWISNKCYVLWIWFKSR